MSQSLDALSGSMISLSWFLKLFSSFSSLVLESGITFLVVNFPIGAFFNLYQVRILSYMIFFLP